MKVEDLYSSNIYNSNPNISRKFVTRLDLLKVGCGTGDLSKNLVNNNQVFGIDISDKSITIA